MSKKTTIAAAVVVVVAGAIAAVPYLVQPKVKALVEHAQLPEGVSNALAVNYNIKADIESISYQQSGLSAQSITRLHIQNNSNPSEKSCIDVQSDIDYGYGALFSGHLYTIHSILMPTSSDATCNIVNNPKLQQHKVIEALLEQSFKAGSPLSSQVSSSWFGKIHTTIKLAQRTLTEPNKSADVAGTLNIQPLTLQIQRDDRHLVSSYQWGGVTWLAHSDMDPSEQFHLSVGQMSGHSNQKQYKDSDALWFGTSELKLGAMKFSITEGDKTFQQLAISGMSLSSLSKKEHDQLNSQFDAELTGIDINHVQLGDLVMNVAADQMNIAAYTKFAKLLREHRELAQNSPKEFRQLLMQHLAPLLDGMKLTLSPLKLGGKDKQVSLAGTVSMGKVDDALMQQLGGVAGLQAALAKSAQADLNAVIDTAMLDKIVQAVESVREPDPARASALSQRIMMIVTRVLDMQTQAGYLNYNSATKRYTTELKYSQGHLTSNGH
ncbi:DUF945 family protein [Celerinatantimonas yamalensis]|uniref:DUF945 family protein n=1 Tax=Celerinatantimonas yamalensis TaxID=559956 RepID=A0ABW9G8Z2_9GAMM